jgi:hypothetical protein
MVAIEPIDNMSGDPVLRIQPTPQNRHNSFGGILGFSDIISMDENERVITMNSNSAAVEALLEYGPYIESIIATFLKILEEEHSPWNLDVRNPTDTIHTQDYNQYVFPLEGYKTYTLLYSKRVDPLDENKTPEVLLGRYLLLIADRLGVTYDDLWKKLAPFFAFEEATNTFIFLNPIS